MGLPMNFSVWMCLMISLTAAHREFPENFVVAKRSEQYTLTCNSKAGEAVTWKLGDNSLEDEENVELNGPNLTVLEVDMPSLGKYSCWKGEEMLSSTYLLLEDDEEHDLNSLITCRAKSYDCNFSCTWTSNEYTAVRLGLGQDCGQFPDGRLQFELSHNLSPYAEESTMLELTAEAISDRSIFRTTKRFYLRDIGKLSKTEPHQWHSVEDYHLKSTFCKMCYDENESPCKQSVKGKNALLMPEVWGEWPDCFELIVRG
uniref:Interleukin-12 beta central domain-containing protein n=1 Tax=Amphilophus citrinellus TaxID=61819 RepID=A0A3Q0SHE2_AMPCI